MAAVMLVVPDIAIYPFVAYPGMVLSSHHMANLLGAPLFFDEALANELNDKRRMFSVLGGRLSSNRRKVDGGLCLITIVVSVSPYLTTHG